jgi:hypothetical protein
VMGRVTKINMTFYSSREWESDGPGRVTNGGGVDSMF